MLRDLAIVPSTPSTWFDSTWFNAALWKVAAASAVLAPLAIGARIAGTARRALLEAELATSALAMLGIRERPLDIERLGGGRSNAVYRLRFASRTLVLKQGLSEGTLLAFAARWVGPQSYANDVTAAGRIGREARALTVLHAAGVRVPRVVAANPGAGLLLVEYVEGESLPATLHRPGAAHRIRAYALAIRAAHRAGVTLGDGHPGNALVGPDNTITLIDLEFAEVREPVNVANMFHGASSDFAARCAFDLAYASQYFTDDERGAFLAAALGDIAAAAVRAAGDRLVDFGALFARERRRQRPAESMASASSTSTFVVDDLDARRAA